MSDTTALIVSRLVLARLLGVHQDTVTRYAGEGMPVRKPGHRNSLGEYDAIACAAWWRSRKVGSLEVERARRERSQADLNELKLQRQRGELVPARDVELLWSRRVVTARTTLLGLPTRLKARRPALLREDLTAADDLIRESLEALAADAGDALIDPPFDASANGVPLRPPPPGGDTHGRNREAD